MSNYSKPLLELIREYEDTDIEFPYLKTVTIAMWLLESARGSSKLALEHRNFAGMKYNSIITDVCKRITYKSEYYCEFENIEDFITGFWGFFEQEKFNGWRDERTARKFISFIGPIWSEDANYSSKVIGLLDEADKLLAKAVKEKRKKIAIVIGHNKVSRGATAIQPLNRNEFDFNSELANLMEKKSNDYNVNTKLFYREKNYYRAEIEEVYRKVNEWNPDYSIELHFNAVETRTVTGSEVLHSNSTNSKKFAKLIQDEMVALFHRKVGDKTSRDRGIRALKKGDRGHLSIVSGRAPAIIVEPFFGSSESDCRLMSELGLDKLADAYLSAMSKL